MLENVSIIIPFQTDNGPRAEAFEWLLRYYRMAMPKAELRIGIIDETEINKSKAVNEAAKRATRDIFVIADADILFDPEIIVKSIELLKESPWVVPFNEIYDVPMEVTKNLLKTEPKYPIDISLEECKKVNWIYDEFAGKLNVIPREYFEAVGGFDERFIGWGGEDDAFAHSVNTICGKFVNLKASIFHLWHPPAYWNINPNAKANGDLLNYYIKASGNKERTLKLIKEREVPIENIQHQEPKNLNQLESKFKKSPKSKICFSILVHRDRELLQELIENVTYYCPNSTLVLYNGGEDPNLCDGLGIPVCPSSRKLERGYTTIYFLETMEWIEAMGVEYEYFINLDYDALFIRKGYEEFINEQMKDTDYMAVKLRIPEEDWYIGNELKKDINRWKELFNVDPFYGIFNVGQVIKRSLVQALLEPERKEKLKKALTETISFGTDEILFVNMAKELDFRIKNYPNTTDPVMIRYRPYFTLEEMIHSINNIKKGWLCHPIPLEKDHLVRRLIRHLSREQSVKLYQKEECPWYISDPTQYSPSLPIISNFGCSEIIIRSGSSLTHYWEDQYTNNWYKSETFAEGVTGIPVFYNNSKGNFEVVCKMKTGGLGFWWRDNQTGDQSWHGPEVIIQDDVDPIMLGQLEDGRQILITKSGDKLDYWIKEYVVIWNKGVSLN